MKILKKVALLATHLKGGYKTISLLSILIFLSGVKITNAVLGFPSWEEIWLAIGNMMIFVGSQILRIAGLLFNCIMDYTVNFSELVTNTAVVGIGWDIFRDLSNMVFIFILLAISIATILGIQSYGAKNLLKNVIIVALLINFSLFTTKVVIDAANVFTVGFYNATIKDSGAAATEGVGGTDWNTGITAIFAASLNLNTIFKAESIHPESKDNFGSKINGMSILLVGMLGFILLIVTAFIFFAASILLMKRIIVLMFLMILSPLAFLGMILPATISYSRQWWNTLFKEAFYAPLFMMFINVVAKAIRSDAFTENISKAASLEGSGFSNLATGGDTMLILFNFILIIGLMLASLISASKIGASGAGGMMSMGKNLNKWGQGKMKAGAGAAVFGVGGRLARKGIGGVAQGISESNFMQNRAAKGGAISKLALKSLRGVGDSSFDVRNTEMGKKMGVGTGIKGGYKTRREESKKSEIAYAKSLKGKSNVQAVEDIIDPTTGKKVGRATKVDSKGKPIMLDRTKAYAEKMANKKSYGLGSIWDAVTKDAGAFKGRKQAGEAIVAETTKKTAFKEAQDKLKKDDGLLAAKKEFRRAKDQLEDAKKSGEVLTDFREATYKAEDEMKSREAIIKEVIEKTKKEYTEAKDKTKEKKA
ncbi:MAG: hypothetical protein U9P50_01910 [Patescibacteria group bacterium]|nr:hypothetical protein [Patescibacteria group bacterium]